MDDKQLAELEQPTKIEFGWMIRRVLPEVLQSERQSFAYPWKQEIFIEALGEQNTVGVVATVRNTVIGFAVYELYPECLIVLNFAVLRDWRRQRIGSHIFDRLKLRLNDNRRFVRIGISEYYTEGQLFLKSMGCKCVQSISTQSLGKTEDALLFEYEHHKS